MEDHQTPWKGRRSTSTTWEEELLVGRRKEGLKASLLCNFTIYHVQRILAVTQRQETVGRLGGNYCLQCVVNAWRALVAGLEGGGQGEVLELGKEGRRCHP